MIRIMILVLLFMYNAMIAQDFQGVATYQTKRMVDFSMEDSKVDSEMQKQIKEMLAKKFQKEYTLQFNSISSIYKEEINLDAPQTSIPGVELVIVGASSSDILYKNTKEKRYTNQRDMFGKTFLVKSLLKDRKWKLAQETKKIGNYTCYKATATRAVNKYNNTVSHDNTNREPKEVVQTLTVWYTPEIPVSNGPSRYWGLPGLILEANDGEETILCTKIVLNPKKAIDIKEPKKGKIVTEEKFNAILVKKQKEMEDTMPHGDGNSIEFKIGG
ncbi:GLPGLI family protein [Aquimarina sp. 2201CG1-2-11]|uniref:GLPGLI family protein n=1 Tax=Aquimarina discodermiae TaxID=3231043 RepID=UPI0034618C3C